MRIYTRCITLGATAGLLMLGGVSVLSAQETQPRDSFTETGAVSATDSMTDTTGQPGATTDTAAKPGATTDTSGIGVSSDTGQTGVRGDTALKAKPGVQTGPVRGDTGVPSDTALHAKPGTQTGKTPADSTTAKSDSMR